MERKCRGAGTARGRIKAGHDDVLRGCEVPRPSPSAFVAMVLEQAHMRAASQTISQRNACADGRERKDRDAPIESIIACQEPGGRQLR
jgi:hypothetical protein